MRPRLDYLGKGSAGPGPNYQIRGFNEHGKHSPPAYTLVSRKVELGKFAQ